MRGGQVSIEYLSVMAFSLLLLVPLLFFFFTQSDDIRTNVQDAQAQAAVNALIASAERVYYSGPPSFETVTITIPQGADSFTVSNVSIILTMRGRSPYDLLGASDVPLIPTAFSSTPGPQAFRVEATVGGVQITEQ